MTETSGGQITRLLGDLVGGRAEAAEELLPLVYEELRIIARKQMRREDPNHTLQPTALVNEAYMKLFRPDELKWRCRAEFFATAANAMRRVLVAHARKKNRVKGPGPYPHIPLLLVDLSTEDKCAEFLALDEAIQRLASMDPRAFAVVRFRYYAGLSTEQTAAALNLSTRTVKREWQYARVRLFEDLNEGDQ
jgi:RNA polymerase sigma-70 factor (ECF subfamily)